MKRQISRELDRLELLLAQIKAVEAERNTMLAKTNLAPVKMLMGLKGIGASLPWLFGQKDYSATSTTGDRLALTPDLRRHHGKVGSPTANKGSPNRETRGCGRP
jgi:transposase